MFLSNEFSYNRKYYVKDLFDKKNIFKYINSLEFESFNVFINRFLKDTSWFDLSLERLVIPIESKEQIDIISRLYLSKMPHIFLYIKDIKCLDTFDFNLDNVSLMIDDDKVLSFRQFVKESKNQNLIDFLSKSIGFVRINISSNDIGNIANKYHKSISIFPYFSICEAYWDFNSFKDTKIKDLNPLIYDIKFLRGTISTSSKDETIYWKDFLDTDCNDKYSKYKFDISQYCIYKSLYLTETGIKCDKTMLKDIISYDDLSNLNFESLNRLCGIFCIKFTNFSNYTSYYQNYLDNYTYYQLPYLNQIINEIFEKGQI